MNRALQQWQQEIEQRSRGLLVVVPVETDPLRNVLTIPPAFPGRDIVAQLLSGDAVVAQLLAAHAINVNVDGPRGVFHFILMNRARAADWDGLEDSLLAHELGHIWLNGLGYRSLAQPVDASPQEACLATHANDIVQHVLIRDEARHRGVDVMAFWLRVHTAALATPLAPPASPCDTAQAFAEWMDAVLGAPRWDSLGKYEARMRDRYPELAPRIARMRAQLEGLNLWDRSLYEHALLAVASELRTIIQNH